VSGTMTLLQLGGYVGLLLWGTHMVSTGVERGFSSELRLWLGRTLSRPGRWMRFCAMLGGLAVTAVLQSSTATGLMVTSFAAKGGIDLAPALAVMLGANLGSTLITQILAFDIAEVAPVLVLIGVVLFRSSDDGRNRNLGRVGIGLGLILLALGALVHTLQPLEDASALHVVLGSLGGEPGLAVLIAAALTWACHSSVAVVLLIGSLAASGVIAPTGSLALVLGANLGSTLPALLEAGTATALRLPLGNLLVRAVGCLIALPFLSVIAGFWYKSNRRRPAGGQLPHGIQLGACRAVPAVDRLGRRAPRPLSTGSAASQSGEARSPRTGRSRQREHSAGECHTRDAADG
jgi:phosphate:Na+ symporter